MHPVCLGLHGDRTFHSISSSISCSAPVARGYQQSTMAMSRTKNRDEQDERNSVGHESEGGSEGEDDGEEDEVGEGEGEEEEEEEELTEYEKQRLKTIEKNKAMLAALQLPTLASTLAAETPSRKGKQPQPAAAAATTGPRRRSERVKKGGRSSAVYDCSGSSEKSGSDSEGYVAGSVKRSLHDQEYEPSDEEDEEASQSESEETVHEEEMEEGALHSRNTIAVPDYIDMGEEELALQQALALSLGASPGEAIEQPTSSKKGKNKTTSKKGQKSAELSPFSSPTDKQKTQTPVRKRQKMRNDLLQFTTGEIDSFFALIDEKGRGQLTLADLEIASTLHDFLWSSLELQDMIQFFDSNHDGMLDVADFRSIAVRCNLIRPEG